MAIITSKFKKLEYNTKLTSRSNQMSRQMTKAEQVIWFNLLSKKQLGGFKFTKQKIIHNYIVDFYCSELLLVIEIDGESHNEKQEYDKQRVEFLKSIGLDVVSFTNDDVIHNLEGVREKLLSILPTTTPVSQS